MDLVFEILGWIGAAAILLGYFLISVGRIRNGLKYQLINLIGASSLLVNAIVNEVWAFVMLNAVWTATAIYALARLSAKRGRGPAAGGHEGDTAI